MTEPAFVGAGDAGNEGSKHFKVVVAERIKAGTTEFSEEPTYRPGSKYAFYAYAGAVAGDATKPASTPSVNSGSVLYNTVVYDYTGDYDGTNRFTYPATETKSMAFAVTAHCDFQLAAADVPNRVSLTVPAGGIPGPAVAWSAETVASARDLGFSDRKVGTLAFNIVLAPGDFVEVNYSIEVTTADAFVGTLGHFSMMSLGYVEGP